MRESIMVEVTYQGGQINKVLLQAVSFELPCSDFLMLLMLP